MKIEFEITDNSADILLEKLKEISFMNGLVLKHIKELRSNMEESKVSECLGYKHIYQYRRYVGNIKFEKDIADKIIKCIELNC